MTYDFNVSTLVVITCIFKGVIRPFRMCVRLGTFHFCLSLYGTANPTLRRSLLPLSSLISFSHSAPEQRDILNEGLMERANITCTPSFNFSSSPWRVS